ncbi:hypothetical protein [Streptomyces sp. RPT161]|uniref:hypothetical protein n=1 Tax=Streptomyces sp. RPT161 TaxID=3015993 RepID=UPI0022B89751|nr:hypothetical protein [Streptomyces sp. RPT161]
MSAMTITFPEPVTRDLDATVPSPARKDWNDLAVEALRAFCTDHDIRFVERHHPAEDGGSNCMFGGDKKHAFRLVVTSDYDPIEALAFVQRCLENAATARKVEAIRDLLLDAGPDFADVAAAFMHQAIFHRCALERVMPAARIEYQRSQA